jgi:hypothetical protein
MTSVSPRSDDASDLPQTKAPSQAVWAANLSGPQSLDHYACVRNSPMSLVDPLGLVCEPDLPNSNCESPSSPHGGGFFGGYSAFDLMNIPVGFSSFPDLAAELWAAVGVVEATGKLYYLAWGIRSLSPGGQIMLSLSVEYPYVGNWPNVGPASPGGGASPQGQAPAQAANNGPNNGKPVPCEDQACELARAVNKTGVQALQNPCTPLAFYAGSAAGATGASVVSDGALFPEIADAVVDLAIRYHLSPRPVQWLVRQVGYAAVWLGSNVQSGCDALQP